MELKESLDIVSKALAEKVDATLKATLARNGIEVPEKFAEHDLKKINYKLIKKNKKLLMCILSFKVKGEREIVKQVFCEVVKKGLKLGTFKNMIKRYMKLISPEYDIERATWEMKDFYKVYGV